MRNQSEHPPLMNFIWPMLLTTRPSFVLNSPHDSTTGKILENSWIRVTDFEIKWLIWMGSCCETFISKGLKIDIQLDHQELTKIIPLCTLVTRLKFQKWLSFMKYSRKSRKRLRQVSGINYFIKMSTYRLACRDSEVMWVGWLILSNK